MTTTPNEEFTAFTQQDIVYDDGCEECGKDTDAPLAFVNREDPEYVIHESCLYNLLPREREAFIAIRDVPSGKPTVAEKVNAMIGESLDEDEEYELDEPVTLVIGMDSPGMTEEEQPEKGFHFEKVEVPNGQTIINVEFGKE